MLFLRELFICASKVLFVLSFHIRMRDLSSLNEKEFCWGKYNVELPMREIPLILDKFRECFNICREQNDLDKMEKLFHRMVATEPLLRDSYYMGEIGYRAITSFTKLINLVELYRTKLRAEKSFRKREAKGFSDKLSTIHLQPSSSEIVPLILAAEDTDKIEACGALLGLNNYDDIVKQNETIFIPMPIIGDVDSEKSITMPMFENYTVSLNDKDSANILVDYYILSMRCLTLTRKQRHAAYLFNVQFLKWILENVLPSLPDDELHPAFEGVMKILATMKSIGTLGSDGLSINDLKNNTSALRSGKLPTAEQEADSILKETIQSRPDLAVDVDSSKKHGHVSCPCKALLYIVVFIIIFAWLMMAALILGYCFKMGKDKQRKKRRKEAINLKAKSNPYYPERIGEMAEHLETLACRIHTLLQAEAVLEDELIERELHYLEQWRYAGSGDAATRREDLRDVL